MVGLRPPNMGLQVLRHVGLLQGTMDILRRHPGLISLEELCFDGYCHFNQMVLGSKRDGLGIQIGHDTITCATSNSSSTITQALSQDGRIKGFGATQQILIFLRRGLAEGNAMKQLELERVDSIPIFIVGSGAAAASRGY